MSDDPTAWLGDPILMLEAESGSINVHVPPSARNIVVISVLDAQSPLEPSDAPTNDQNAFVKLGLADVVALQRSLDAAVAQLQEHGGV